VLTGSHPRTAPLGGGSGRGEVAPAAAIGHPLLSPPGRRDLGGARTTVVLVRTLCMRSLAWILLASLVGCVGEGPKSPDDAEHGTAGVVPPAGPASEQLQPIRVVGFTATELVARYEEARALLLEERYEEAAQAFDHLARLAEDPHIASMALYEAGVAHAGRGEHGIALERFEAVLERHRDAPIAKNAQVQVTRLYGYLERWRDLERAATALLARADLPLMDKIEGHGAHALALVEQGRIEEARTAVGKAQAIIDREGFGRSGTPPVQLAQVAFAEGEIRRLQSEQIKLTPVPPNFGAVLEARCQGLLDAQAAYTEAMRSRDAHWSAMAGFRIGQLYQDLHREAMDIPAPEGTNLKQKQLFTGAMRLRYRILLEKGLKMMDGIVRLAERTGEASVWIARAREAKRNLEQSLADEKAALELLPYSESEVREALEKLRGKPAPANPSANKP
jgi:tetratricopeptide (TPR) repeat protein